MTERGVVLLPLLLPHLVPIRIAEFAQEVELAGALQPFAAVDGDDLAVDVAGAIRQQERGKVRQLLVPAGRPSGLLVSNRCARSGRGTSRSHAPWVGNGPGAIAFRRTPWPPHSTARLRVMASTPAFAIADGTT